MKLLNVNSMYNEHLSGIQICESILDRHSVFYFCAYFSTDLTFYDYQSKCKSSYQVFPCICLTHLFNTKKGVIG